MKHHYLLICDVHKAGGTETWEVYAENEADALEMHKQGRSEFVDQEVKVTDLGEPEIILDD